MTESRRAKGLYARIRVRPVRECILRQLSEEHVVQQYMPGTPDGNRPQVLVEPATETEGNSLNADSIEQTIWLGDRVVCLLRHCESTPPKRESTTENQPPPDSRNPNCGMVLYGFGHLPVAPVAVQLSDGWLELHFVTTAYPKLRETISDLREAAFDVDLRQVVQSDRTSVPLLDELPMLSMVDLSVLTDRQREVATVAIEMGYFEETGATAEETADALDISKSTLSEHLRIVIRKLLSQIIP
ncbi:helix-turn-helix domain-containing protein [Halohasta litchfieldiae]|nr:helix-turn-helix domain-containing protein [Halohasta litchfieldiae]